MKPFDVDRFHSLRRERGLTLAGDPLHWSPVTGSTNDDALSAARAAAPGGTTFVAEQQTNGRGRYGRSWHAESGASLLFSVIIREPLTLERLACLPLASGVGVRRALARQLPALDASREVLIKWPNDIWVSGKKIAGVLVESQIEANTLRAAVIGVGINLQTTEWPEELQSVATSITLSGGEVEREALLVDLLEALSSAVRSLTLSGLDSLMNELSRYDALLGRRVQIAETVGIASGIDARGRLQVRQEGGGVSFVSSGTVLIGR